LALAPLANEIQPPPPVDFETPLVEEDLLLALAVEGRLAARGDRAILDTIDAIPPDIAAPVIRLPLVTKERSLTFERSSTNAGRFTLRGLGRGILAAYLTDSGGNVLCKTTPGRDTVTCILP